MKISQSTLIAELRASTKRAISDLETLNQLSDEVLNRKLNPTSWSVLECIEHLNRYGEFYLPEIEKQLIGASEIDGRDREFRSGVLGEYFVGTVKPTSKKKLKATKEMDTTGSDLSKATIDRFLKQLKQLDSLLTRSEKVDLTKVRTSISLTKLIRLRLGDTLRFLVTHNDRHILQAQRLVND